MHINAYKSYKASVFIAGIWMWLPHPPIYLFFYSVNLNPDSVPAQTWQKHSQNKESYTSPKMLKKSMGLQKKYALSLQCQRFFLSWPQWSSYLACTDGHIYRILVGQYKTQWSFSIRPTCTGIFFATVVFLPFFVYL